MKRTGYRVESFFTGHVNLLELEIMGESTQSILSYAGKTVWPTASRKVIWSSDPNSSLSPIINPEWHSNVFFSLQEAKKKIVSELTNSRIDLNDRSKQLQADYTLICSADLTTIPKDDYKSPFTGETK